MKPLVLPVIHYADDEQALRNVARAAGVGCEGVFLIEMAARNGPLLPVALEAKRRWPHLLVGLNLLNVEPRDALAVSLANGIDMTWTDEQPTHSENAPWLEGRRLAKAAGGHPLFVGVGFKYQRRDRWPEIAALKAVEFGLIPTTSGPATGSAADPGAVAELRRALGPKAPLAIASGITPDNVSAFAPHVSHILVATGVAQSFHELDPKKLSALREGMTAIADQRGTFDG